MHRRLGLALSLSVLLIGGATWFRFVHAEKQSPTLTVVNNTSLESEITIVDGPLSYEDPVASAGAGLNATDLVGRQLVSDYLNLASDGQATDANVARLVDNYATNLSNLNSFKPYTTAEINIISTSQATLKSYGDAVSNIYNKYHALAGNTITTAGDLGSVGSKKFDTTMTALGSLCEKAAKELETVPTPDTLADTHLQLVNNYIASANALKALGNSSVDAATAYAALSTQVTNDTNLVAIFLSIQKKLLASGILFNAGT